MLFKWLEERDYVGSIKNLTIEKIQPQFQCGNLTHKRQDTKAVVMPLKIQFRKLFEENCLLKNMLDNINNLMQKTIY